MLLPVASAIPIKVSNSKRPSHFARSSLQLGPSCIFRRTAQPSVVCGALSRVRPRSRIAGGVAKRSAHAGVRGAQMMKVRAAPGDVETIAASCPDKRRSSLTTIAFAYATASALLTDRNSLPMPRFCQTCGRKCRAPCGGRSATRGPTEQQPIIMIRRMAQRNPSQIARNFETTALSGQP